MLKKLSIQNYAIIDEIEINFSSKLNIITGETGAGKSILMGALNLILGERADTSVLLKSDKKCFIEGYFSLDKKLKVIDYLKENDFYENDELVLRREITPNGKSRAFINDTPATLQQIKIIASHLVDLHQQFDTLELGDSDFQREVIDALANTNQLLEDYKKDFKQYTTFKKELAELHERKNSFSKEYDYNKFLLDELDSLQLKENEIEELEEEFNILNNCEQIKSTLNEVLNSLENSEQPIVQQLKVLQNQISSISSFQSSLPNLSERIKSAQIEIQDIADELNRVEQNIFFNQERIEIITDRLNLANKLLKKHQAQSTNNLLEIYNNLSVKMDEVLQIDDLIENKEKETDTIFHQLQEKAKQISLKRKKQLEPFEEDVNSLLHQVGMPNAYLKVVINLITLNENGIDDIEFLFDANKSNKFEPLRKVASGGELSRLMLCIKSLVAKSIDLPTLIFDEIDSGISGEAAKQVGIIMKDLSKSRQVISITHQPQIAGKADAHYFVYKEIKNSQIKTNIRLLNNNERINIIAQMLSGEKPTAAAVANAKEMLMN